jgi:hexosaminidase
VVEPNIKPIHHLHYLPTPSADASDAYDFNIAVNNYLVDKSVENQIAITNYFRKWISMNSDLVEMSTPLVQPLLPLSQV